MAMNAHCLGFARQPGSSGSPQVWRPEPFNEKQPLARANLLETRSSVAEISAFNPIRDLQALMDCRTSKDAH